MDDHAGIEIHAGEQGLDIEHGIEIDPFPAVIRPGPAAERLFEIGYTKLFFELSEVAANHGSTRYRVTDRDYHRKRFRSSPAQHSLKTRGPRRLRILRLVTEILQPGIDTHRAGR